MAEMHQVDVYWSMQSPYCYFLLDRLTALDRRADVSVNIRLVRPGVLRLPEVFRNRSVMEQRYFDRDARRTAAFLGMAYAEADPYPVTFEAGLWVATPDQPRIDRLNALVMAATDDGTALALLDRLMRLIWDGNTPDWDQGDHVHAAVRDAGLDPGELDAAIADAGAGYVAQIDDHEQQMYRAGHWGVPLMVYRDEPFYGQDRFDQLVWRMEGGT